MRKVGLLLLGILAHAATAGAQEIQNGDHVLLRYQGLSLLGQVSATTETRAYVVPLSGADRLPPSQWRNKGSLTKAEALSEDKVVKVDALAGADWAGRVTFVTEPESDTEGKYFVEVIGGTDRVTPNQWVPKTRTEVARTVDYFARVKPLSGAYYLGQILFETGDHGYMQYHGGTNRAVIDHWVSLSNVEPVAKLPENTLFLYDYPGHGLDYLVEGLYKTSTHTYVKFIDHNPRNVPPHWAFNENLEAAQ